MRNAKIDDNHKAIVTGLRDIGATVQSLAMIGKGTPDLLVGFRSQNYLFEVKDGDKVPSKKKLTLAEAIWHSTWKGSVLTVESLDDALRAIGAAVNT